MEEVKLNKRIDELEKIVEKKLLEQKKMEMAVRELEKVVKAMSQKVIHLEEDIVMIKDDNLKTSMNDPFKVAQDFQNSTPVSEIKEIISVVHMKVHH